MIELYGMGSPNVLKILIMLEEIGRPYRFHHVDVMRGQGRTPEFLRLNPLGKVPVITDDASGTSLTIFESGAILIYLAETYGAHLLPSHGPERWEVLKWLFAQVAYAGPMLGQHNHFQFVASQTDSYGGRRYRDQAGRVYRDFDDRLREVTWLGGAAYSIADIAMYPWAGYLKRHGFDENDHPHILRWRKRIDAREQVRRAVAAVGNMIAAVAAAAQAPTDKDYDLFFGRSAPGPAPDHEHYMSLGSFTSIEPG